MFGGFATKSWPSIENYDDNNDEMRAKDDQAFIFSINRQTKHPVKVAGNALCKEVLNTLNSDSSHHSAMAGKEREILFAFGNDIVIFEKCDRHFENYSRFGKTFQAGNLPGNEASGKLSTYLANSKNF